MNALTNFVHSRWYWSAIIVVAISLECIGLFYQHVLGEPPCVLCIQYRVWIVVGVLGALIGLFLHRIAYVALAAQALVLVALTKMMLTTHTLVLVERGLYEGNCGMDPGFPAWLPLDQWFPNVFEVWAMCGYTPNFLFGLTMGEGMYIGTLALIAIALFALALMIHRLIKK